MFKLPQKKQGNKRIYLDYAATTPVRTEVFDVMKPYFTECFGNASSIHHEGRLAHEAVEAAREEVARCLHVRPADVTFTSGGTESNNLAVLGHVRALLNTGMLPGDIEVVSTAMEHPSISKVFDELVSMGVCVNFVPVDEEGRVVLSEFEKLLSPKTRLVSVAYAASETGVVQDIGKIARMVRAYEKEVGTEIVVHTDACQAPLWLSCEPERLGADMLSLDSGKCYGPKGVGVLVHRARASLVPVTFGGSQESGLRPGTENTPLVVGCAKAIEIAQNNLESRSEAVSSLRDMFIETLLSSIDGVVVNGSREHRIANNVNISIPGIDSEFAVVKLDSAGVAASTRSACSGADGGGSAVIRAMTADEARAKSTLRFSLGEETTREEIEKTVEILRSHVEKMRTFTEALTQS